MKTTQRSTMSDFQVGQAIVTCIFIIVWPLNSFALDKNSDFAKNGKEKYHLSKMTNEISCFNQKSNLSDSMKCVFQQEEECKNATDHSDSSEGNCSGTISNNLLNILHDQERVFNRMSKEAENYYHQTNLIWELNRSIICSWSEIIFQNGSDIGRLKGRCNIEMLVSQVYNNVNVIEYSRQKN